jgi:phosphatidylserine/phosphatidylglycerophosphate/cardiolipin synthase-like enzyme/uncharacterized membrane protein YdjX (TVP38/TMEM64 family)
VNGEVNSEQEWKYLLEGKTCGRKTAARRVAMLVDAANYFAALRSSLLKAKHSVFIAGWDIDSRTPIRGETAPDDGAPECLGPLLTHLIEHNPKLVIHIILWDYSVLYALEREPIPRLNLDWRTPRRVRVCLDDELPLGASYHEKLVVVDDAVAYCGGVDLTTCRWDTTDHTPNHPERVDPFDKHYKPFHDVQLLVDGKAAQSLGAHLRKRWQNALSSRLPKLRNSGDPWPDHVEPDLRDVAVGIARTRPQHNGQSELRYVRAAYLHAISQAEKFIYIENQYVTADVVAAALRDRLLARQQLELVIVIPETPSGWLEAQTMGVGQLRFLDTLLDARIAPRVRVVYPWVSDGDGRTGIFVHAKLMVVDDELLLAGSANLNRRSMGVDRECNLLLEARSPEQRKCIAALRRRLLAEHLGMEPDELRARERQSGSVIAVIDGQNSPRRGLAPLPESALAREIWEPLADVADPERPIDPAGFVGDLFGADAIDLKAHRWIKRLGIAVGILAVLAVWRYTPIAEWAEPERVAPLLNALSASPWAGPLVLLTFVIGSLIVFPVTALIAATAIALGPWTGFAWALLGSLLAASATYGIGWLIGPRRLEHMFGAWIKKLIKRLRHGGIVSVMIVRNIPIAPFSLVNVVAGATAMRFRDFLLGTALGMGPGIAMLTVLADRMREMWETPSAANFVWLTVAVGLWLCVAAGLQILSNRLSEDADS